MISPQHLIVDLIECKHLNYLEKPESVKWYIERVCMNLNLTRIGEPVIEQFHHPEDKEKCGITATQVLGESLLSIHTYPEHKCAYIDIFSCSTFNIKTAVEFTYIMFGAKEYRFSLVNRMKLNDLI